jgi:hypothetical protein
MVTARVFCAAGTSGARPARQERPAQAGTSGRSDARRLEDGTPPEPSPLDRLGETASHY